MRCVEAGANMPRKGHGVCCFFRSRVTEQIRIGIRDDFLLVEGDRKRGAITYFRREVIRRFDLAQILYGGSMGY